MDEETKRRLIEWIQEHKYTNISGRESISVKEITKAINSGDLDKNKDANMSDSEAFNGFM